ncbi:hypothetical protein BJY00DRAFT_302339 [Aspergillus carlsbadensis]|nr:hypothetical protein BJY00DRAFT_302339 [Aspergillus carlsbadensis]
MPQPSINLEPYREEISHLYRTNVSRPDIARILHNQYGIQVKIKILYVLSCEGWNIQPHILKYVRHQLGLYRRTANLVADQAEIERVLNQLHTDLATGLIKGYGRRLLHQHFKNQGFFLGRIKIYAAIDAYSCYIIWIYVGISSRTAVSVLQQFHDTLDITQQQPRFYKLQQTLHPEIHIRDCYLYGTSMANQRIEAWWLQLTHGMLFQYQGNFLSNNLADQIALYIGSFPNRPHLVPRKPFINYNFLVTGVKNQGIKFNMDLFRRLQDDLLYNPQQPPSVASNHVLTPFHIIYLELRSRIQTYIQAGSQPVLQLSQPPIGAFNWDPRQNGMEDLKLVQEVKMEYNQAKVEELEN